MALKDSLKHFSSENGYDVVVTKPDLDNNLDILADGVDAAGGFIEDATLKAYIPKILSIGIVIGADKFDLVDSDNGDFKMFFNREKGAFRAGAVNASAWDDGNIGNGSFACGVNTTASGESSFACGSGTTASKNQSFACGYNTTASEKQSFACGKETTASGEQSFACGYDTTASGEYGFACGYDTTASGKFSFACGWGATASGDNSFACGINTTASGVGSFITGGGTEAKQMLSLNVGAKMETASMSTITTIPQKTTDEKQTTGNYPISLSPKGIFTLKLSATALKDDYSTKWIFEREIVVTTDADGKVTIVSDDNTDKVKDDSDWAFDIASTDDDTTPTVDYKMTGKADTNIAWSVKTEILVNTF